MANSIKKEKKVNVHAGHRERLKEVYKKNGIEALHQHVVLELLLFFGIPYKDTNEIAHELINKFGSFSGVLEADISALKSVKNMTWNAAILIRLVADISRLYYMNKLSENEVFDTREKVGKYLLQKYLGETDEKVYLLLFDKHSHITDCIHLSTGNRSLSEINIGKIVKLANTRNVTKIAIAHNHPDNSIVSSDDIVSYRRLVYHLKSVGINLFESYVVSKNKAISLYDMVYRNNTNGEQQ